MPTELEELVEFIHHGNTPIRQLAVENCVPYSLSQPSIFKVNQLEPVTDLKLLVRDYEVNTLPLPADIPPPFPLGVPSSQCDLTRIIKQIAKNALTILINISTDREILECLAADERFLEDLLARVTRTKEPNANLIAMLLANLAKWDDFKNIINIQRPTTATFTSTKIMDQLMDCFVKGADGSFNPAADFDYLAYLFADISKHASGRAYFVTEQEYDHVIPITKLTVFTEHKSVIRRKGVASTIKNVAFDVPTHPEFLSTEAINVLPYLLLPLMGNEEYAEEDMLDMLPDLQLLPPDKQREGDVEIIKTHVETLMLLTTMREGRDLMREVKVYPIIRELHLRVEDEAVREACERLVQVLMRDEEGEEVGGDMVALVRSDRPKRIASGGGTGSWAAQDSPAKEDSNEDDDDDEIVEV